MVSALFVLQALLFTFNINIEMSAGLPAGGTEAFASWFTRASPEAIQFVLANEYEDEVIFANLVETEAELFAELDNSSLGDESKAHVFEWWGTSITLCNQRIRTASAPLSLAHTQPASSSSSSWQRTESKRKSPAPGYEIQRADGVKAKVAPHPSASKLSEKENKAVAARVESLWEYFEDLGDCGSLWSEYASLSPDMQIEHRTLMTESWSGQALNTLSGAVTTLQSWILYAQSKNENWRKASSTCVATWLR